MAEVAQYDRIDRVIAVLDRIIRPLIWYSVAMYLIEVSVQHTRHSLEGHWLFLWSERCVAVVLTMEYLLRLYRNQTGRYWRSAMGVIDLIACLPFWVGFFAPLGWLGYIRAARVLRLLKFFRYSRNLQLTALGFYRAWDPIKGLVFTMFICVFFCSVVVYEAEKTAQRDRIQSLFDAFWFILVTITTVGYGDIYPITTAGKIFTVIVLIPMLAIAGALLGVIMNAFESVAEDEKKPDVDPVKLLQQERKRRRQRRKIERSHGVKF